MKRTFLYTALILGVVIMILYLRTGSFAFISHVKDYTQKATNPETLQENLTTIAGAITKEISNPLPLIWKNDSDRAHLTHDGVVLWTNSQRQTTSNLPALQSNALLDRVAEARLKDMFAKQYFEHISPTGIGATNIAEDMGYNYTFLGENIALGNFENDQVLVQAWMDSPGHRANILNTKFREIGVAVGQGMYEGKKTWIGVQVFGKPNTCAPVDLDLKKNIQTLTASLDQGKVRIEALQKEIQTMQTTTAEDRTAYNKKVEEYNIMARDLNALGSSIKTLVAKYNTEVRAFNACIAE